MATPLQSPYAQFFDDNGDPLSGGKVYTYVAGTTTNKATYTDASESTQAANPIILDAYGRAAIWLSGTYRFDVKTSADVLVRSVDQVPAFTAGGDMVKSVYDPANIAQQVVGTTAVQTLTNKTLSSTASITFSGGTALSNYIEGTWTPSPTSLTVVGTPTYTGRYTRIGNMVIGTLEVVSTTTTAATANSTYFTGLPVAPAYDSTCQAVNGANVTSYGVGLVDAGTNRLFVPSWSATAQVMISFVYFV